jgi:hypothetical protein
MVPPKFGFCTFKVPVFLAVLGYFEQNTTFAAPSHLLMSVLFYQSTKKRKPPVTGNVKGRQFEID